MFNNKFSVILACTPRFSTKQRWRTVGTVCQSPSRCWSLCGSFANSACTGSTPAKSQTGGEDSCLDQRMGCGCPSLPRHARTAKGRPWDPCAGWAWGSSSAGCCVCWWPCRSPLKLQVGPHPPSTRTPARRNTCYWIYIKRYQFNGTDIFIWTYIYIHTNIH